MGLLKADTINGREPLKGLFFLEFLLVGVGSAVLFSGSWYFSLNVFNDPFRIWRRQMMWIALGLLFAFFTYRLDRDFIKRSVPYLVWAALIMNLLTYVPGIGYSSGGAQRWLEIYGVTFQPSEFIRVVIVLYLARMLEKNQERINNFRDSVMPPMIIVFVLVLTIYFQNDYSTATFLLILSLGMFFAAGVSRVVIGGFGFIAAIVAIVMLIIKPYRLIRLHSWFQPYADPGGAGYQFLKARKALEYGGFWGQGLGLGSVKLGGLPAAHSDFVMAVLGEEGGLIAVGLVLILFTLFALKGWRISREVRNTFACWAIFGFVAIIYWQVLVNLSVVSGLLPATGIPLPLFSAGGSAATMTIVMFGLIHKLASDNK